jgi:hypothetical protein
MSATHNDFLLPHNVWAVPQAVFDISPMRERSLHNALKRRVEARLPIAEIDLRQLANFSHSAAEFLLGGWLKPGEIDILLENPAHRFAVLLEDYDALAPSLEKPLETHPESVERLIVYFRKHERSGQHSEGYYLELLRGDPDRYLRVANNPPDDVRDALLRETLDKRFVSPEHAYFFLHVNSLTTLDRGIAKALAKSEYHSYLAAKHLKNSGVPAAVYNPIVSRLKTPRWLYHALRDGLVMESEGVIERLVSSPAWTVEWLVTSRATLEHVERVYSKCFLTGAGASTFHDLHLWFQHRQIAAARGEPRLLASAPA